MVIPPFILRWLSRLLHTVGYPACYTYGLSRLSSSRVLFPPSIIPGVIPAFNAGLGGPEPRREEDVHNVDSLFLNDAERLKTVNDGTGGPGPMGGEGGEQC